MVLRILVLLAVLCCLPFSSFDDIFPYKSLLVLYLPFYRILWFLTFPLFHDDASGVSSFNRLIHELSMDSDSSSTADHSSGEEDNDSTYPQSPLSQSSRLSRASSYTKDDKIWTCWIIWIFSWIMFPVKFLLGIPFLLYHLSFSRGSKSPSTSVSHQPSPARSLKRVYTLKDHPVHLTTDRRRGVIEVAAWNAL